MVSDYYQRRQISPKDLRGGLLAQGGGSLPGALITLTVCFRRLPWNLPSASITDRQTAQTNSGGRTQTLHQSNTYTHKTNIQTHKQLCLHDNLGSSCGSLRSRHGGNIDFIVRICLGGLALHDYLVPAGHDYTHRQPQAHFISNIETVSHGKYGREQRIKTRICDFFQRNVSSK